MVIRYPYGTVMQNESTWNCDSFGSQDPYGYHQVYKLIKNTFLSKHCKIVMEIIVKPLIFLMKKKLFQIQAAKNKEFEVRNCPIKADILKEESNGDWGMNLVYS